MRNCPLTFFRGAKGESACADLRIRGAVLSNRKIRARERFPLKILDNTNTALHLQQRRAVTHRRQKTQHEALPASNPGDQLHRRRHTDDFNHAPTTAELARLLERIVHSYSRCSRGEVSGLRKTQVQFSAMLA